MKLLANAITTAYEWHGGMSSPLYSFASTRTVHSEDHRERLLAEIASDRAYALGAYDADELDRLDKLRDIVSIAKIGKPLMSDREYCRLAG